MKLLIIGDSHGNITNLKHTVGFAKKIGAKAVIHTGDWDNLKSFEVVFNYNIPIYTVLGNADINKKLESRIQKLGKTNFNKEFLIFSIDGLKIGVIHNIKELTESKENFDIIFCGHTHKQGRLGNIINPGALEQEINFAIYDTKTKMIEFIHE